MLSTIHDITSGFPQTTDAADCQPNCHPRDNKSDRRLKSSPARSKPAQNSQFCLALFTVLVLPLPLAVDVCQEERGLQAIKVQVRVPYGSSCLYSASKQKTKSQQRTRLKLHFPLQWILCQKILRKA